MSDSRKYDMDRAEAIGTALEHFMAVHEEHFERGYIPEDFEIQLMQNASVTGGYPGYGLFLSTVVGQASGEQMGWWLLRAMQCQITGAYAQTELGHGSNVRGLETTATFDHASKCFILHSPTLTSIKFWPSSMVSATHAAVYAQLWIDNKKYGVHVFMVQLRDEEMRLLPGVTVGDIGSKLGEPSIDIGYLKLDQVHLPLNCMMAKRQHVTESGQYVKHGAKQAPGSDKMAYLTMMNARMTMIGGAAGALSKACTIAIRYAAVRKQGFKDSQEQDETTILDYRFTQYRLLKQLSFVLANKLACNVMQVKMGDFKELANSDKPIPDISELHATTAGMKGYCCERTALGIEDCRKACGGAAYLMSSGIASLEVDYKWRATAEGDTVVLLLETAKYLLKSVATARDGGKLDGLSACLSVLADPELKLESVLGSKPGTAEGWLSLPFLCKLFEARTVAAVGSADRALAARLARHPDEDRRAAMGACTLQLMRAGECHVAFFMLCSFSQAVEQVQDAACQRVLSAACALFGLSEVLEGTMWAGLMDGADQTLAQDAVNIALDVLRPEAVSLVDCFEFPDVVLNSTIGRQDGNVYEASYEAAVKSPLNQTEIPVWLEKIQPFLDLEYLALRDGDEGAANLKTKPASKL